MPFNTRTIIANLPRPPSREERLAAKADRMSPIQIVRTLTLLQWCYLFVGMASWTVDAIDFFSVSLVLTRLAAQFDREPHSLSLAITVTLLFRSLGAFIFGLLGDRFGRRWVLSTNLVIVAALELGTAYADTYGTFIAVRSLFGIGMGGIWGLSSQTALENAPVGARGMLSGIMQEGYALGYLIAAGINLSAVPVHGVAIIFQIGAGLSLFMAICRALLPESEQFRRARAEAKAHADSQGKGATKIYLQSLGTALKLHWATFLYSCLVMTCFNFLSHGSQDIYPAFVEVQKGQSAHNATVLTIIGNCGAIAGGIVAGAISQYLGRRLTIIVFAVWAAAFIPLWVLPTSFSGLAAGAALIQVGVQGAWGVVPIWLSEIMPPAFRATLAGLAYQIGNMVSAASAQIETTSGDNNKILLPGSATPVPDYSVAQEALIATACGVLIILMLFGVENQARHFEQEKTAIEAGGGDDRDTAAAHRQDDGIGRVGSRDLEGGNASVGPVDEKAGSFEHKEKA